MNKDTENIEQHDELEQLRAQVAEFKSRLDQQEIITDRLLRNAVNGKVKSLRKYNNTIYILGGISYLIILTACLVAKVTLVPVLILGALCLAEYFFCTWNLRQISGVAQMSVVDAQTAIVKYIRREKWLNIGEIVPMLALAVWAVIEIHPDFYNVYQLVFTLVIAIAVAGFLLAKQFKMVADIRKSIAALRNESN